MGCPDFLIIMHSMIFASVVLVSWINKWCKFIAILAWKSSIPLSLVCWSFNNRDIGLGKFLGILGIRRNGTFFSHIYGKFHYEFNECTLLWMWGEEVPFFRILKVPKNYS